MQRYFLECSARGSIKSIAGELRCENSGLLTRHCSVFGEAGIRTRLEAVRRILARASYQEPRMMVGGAMLYYQITPLSIAAQTLRDMTDALGEVVRKKAAS